ncbi:GerAB/ArcD/ProY family transporter [Paenibacillus elgii]|uniref:GerAB/ArcD/ProY family transporter n=1 Tax=Paenibacillus elgii TaxID=189691 RepID=UPI000248C581|nr:GerAB/ArcD/ProY family transporter [Paenibacillus elgii]
MDGQRQLSVYQFTVLTILFSLGSTLLVISSGMADELQQDAWLGAALGTLGGLALVALLIYPNVSYEQTWDFRVWPFFFIDICLVAGGSAAGGGG